MSKYTTEVRYICEVSAGLTESAGFTGIDKILDDSIDNVFDFEFPIFDETYRSVLEKKILRHYYTREICEETVGLWKLRLCDRLNMVMPYYNQLYKSELIKFNPLYDVNLVRSNSGKKDSESNNTVDSFSSAQSKTENESEVDSFNVVNTSSENESENTAANAGFTRGKTSTEDNTTQHDESTRTDKYSDTPQGALTGLASGDYLTNARMIDDEKVNTVNATGETNVEQTTSNTENAKQKDSTQGNTTNAGNSKEKNSTKGGSTNTGSSKGRNVVSDTESYIEAVSGKQGSSSYSKLLEEFRRTFLNIDAMVIEELSDLFFGLW